MGKKIQKYIIGVDEAGRGPLAGPVSVGIVSVPYTFDWKLIPGVGDSKQVSEKNRESVYLRAKELRLQKKLNFLVVLIPASTIDRIGISRAVALGIARGLRKLALNPKSVEVRLDGLLHAPKEYAFQETIIKGDAKEKVIGLASICAKVTRDALMTRITSDYPHYDFHIHKGYGTLNHRIAIKKHGLSQIHRKSFCKKYISSKE